MSRTDSSLDRLDSIRHSNKYQKSMNIKGMRRIYTVNEMLQESNNYQLLNGEIPNKTPNGPLLERPITVTYPSLQSMEDAELIPRCNSIPNGHYNSGFDSDSLPPYPEHAASDTSSVDNYKPSDRDDYDPNSDTENIKRRTFPGRSKNGIRDSSISLASSVESTDPKSPWKSWDVFRTYKRVKDEGLDDQTISKFRKIVKVLVCMVLLILVLITTVISKSTLLLITSSIYQNNTLFCVETADHTQFKWCSRVPPDKITDVVYKFSQNVQVRWIWALFVIVVTPYIMTFVKCAWRACFKTMRRPAWPAALAAFISETLNSIGVCIFTFHVLPSLDSLRSLVLTVGVALIPSLLKLFDREDVNGRRCVTYIVDLFAIITQLSAVLLWPIRDIIFGNVTSLTWSIPVSLILISCGYWENYVNKNSSLGILGRKLLELKKNMRRMRVKIYIGVSLWKILFTWALMMAIVSDVKLDCLEVLYFKGDDGTAGCKHLTDPYSVTSVEAKEYFNDAFWIMLVQIASCLLCYTFAKTACKVLLQVGSFALPLTIATPIILGLFISECKTWNPVMNNSTLPESKIGLPSYLHWTCDVNGQTNDYLYSLLTNYYLPAAVLWWLSFIWITAHIWFPRVERLVQTERLFVHPLYCGIFLEQSLILSRRRDDRDREARTEKKTALQFFQTELEGEDAGFKPRGSLRTDVTPMIYVCATMWHETEKEMNQVLKSLFRLDLDQCTRKHAYVFFDVVDPDYYEFEAHFFFDDAFEPHDAEEYQYRANDFVKQIVRVIDKAASAVHRSQIRMDPPNKYPTPYGGRLEWILPGQNKLVVHLKDKMKIRHKKRWSQVMYMYYLLGHRLVAQKVPDARRKQIIADNTFILTLDGDVDFQPSSVQLLVDRMKKNEKVGAACGRIHPIGQGPMIWYQKFEYAVSHWLQKATEHMIGCVLCSPGCFSLFRASALMDDNVMRKYATVSTQAKHYVQYDQGEDRWLCTLLLQQGYRVEYCAAADALTYAPEGFEEFFNQRRRWSPSTMANIMDLLQSWRQLISINENMSVLYMAYQLLLFVSSMLTPGTIFLLIVGAISTAFQEISLIQSLFINLAPVILFLVICLMTRSKVQLSVAAILSIGYALVMMIVIVGLILEMKKDGICAPTTIFMIFVVGVFVISAIMHPLEFYCLFHGMLYLMCIPAMSMLLMIYSITNLNVVSWGTRETLTPVKPSDSAQAKKPAGKPTRLQALLNLFMVGRAEGIQREEDSDYGFSCGNLFKCLCCPKPVDDKSNVKMAAILEKLDNLERRLAFLKDGEGHPQDSVTNEEEGEKSPLLPKIQAEANVKFAPSGSEDVSKQNLVSQESVHSNYEAEFSPFWLMDDELSTGKVRYLGTEETRFWREVIDRYLHPLENDPVKQKKLENDLQQLRNKMSLMFFLLNALFIVIISALQYTNAANDGNGLAIPLPCRNDEGQNLTLEPISLLFMATFGIALCIQFLAMFFHRMGTFLHIIASTEVNCMKLNQQEIAAMDVSDKLELVKQMQKFNDDDEDARSDITNASIEGGGADDSSTTDESPKMRRKRDMVMRLSRKRKRPMVQKGSGLTHRFMERYLKLAKDLRQERLGDKSNNPRQRRRNSLKKRKTMRAIQTIEKSDKTSVLIKAQKMQSLNRARAGGQINSTSAENLQKDPWVNLVRGVISQSRASLNTVSEEEGRASGLVPKRKQTWANSADSTAMTRGRAEGKDGRPISRSSFGGRRNSVSVLTAVTEVITPLQSPTEDGEFYEKVETNGTLRLEDRRIYEEQEMRDPDDTEPNSEAASDRDIEVLSPIPITATTDIAEESPFSFDTASGGAVGSEALQGTVTSFHMHSPGRLIRESHSKPSEADKKQFQTSHF